jgi:hypothetical protein
MSNAKRDVKFALLEKARAAATLLRFPNAKGGGSWAW